MNLSPASVKKRKTHIERNEIDGHATQNRKSLEIATLGCVLIFIIYHALASILLLRQIEKRFFLLYLNLENLFNSCCLIV